MAEKKRTAPRRGSGLAPESEINSAYQKWITRQMDSRILDYSDISPITMCCVTWNVNAKSLPEVSDLVELLTMPETPPADLFVIGLQEIVDLNVVNVMLAGSTSDETAAAWLRKITEALNALNAGEYKLIVERHMVGLQAVAFVKASLAPQVHDIRSLLVATGGYGTTGNKGGITFRFDVLDSPLCFIVSHFHANRNNVVTRNLDFQTICDGAVFPPCNPMQTVFTGSKSGSITGGRLGSFTNTGGAAATSSGDALRPNSVTFQANKGSRVVDLAAHEHVFWLGDLNYRIGGELDEHEIFLAVERDDWNLLIDHDQLNTERENGAVFAGFQEGKLSFPPTYKFQPGTDRYEQRVDKKLRAPAWCDRILYRSADYSTQFVDLTAYYSEQQLLMSDHRPVVAWFDLKVRRVVPDKMRTVYQELLFSVDKWVNASTPKLDVDERIHDLGHITLERKFIATITLSNTGTVMSEWAFVPKNDELMICQPWLKFAPEEGILAPNETMEVTATVYMTHELLYHFDPTYTGGSLTLDEVVILRVIKGSDIFCIFTAQIGEEDVRSSLIIAKHRLHQKSVVAMSAGGASGARAYDYDEDDIDLGDIYGGGSG